ncbi:MAG: DNA replication and repair protein RecF [Candidatus Caenarcaniphilales bacterium]|nr:DNA replication and repair protein RecF [Candidatus Caenarcaniphilales bacterium]
MSLFLNSLKLSNFRNYSGSEHYFNFHEKTVFIIGPNAVGKSNLIEAINYVSFGAHRETDKLIISHDAKEDFFSIEADYKLEERNFHLLVSSGQAGKVVKLNGVSHRYLSSIREEAIKVVVFKAKESLDIVRGSPSKRREWLDTVLSLLDIKYSDFLKRFNRVLEQRNTLLKQLFEGKSRNQIISELEPWDDELVKYGFYLVSCRAKFITESQRQFSENYKKIGDSSPELPSLGYLPSIMPLDEKKFLERIVQNHSQDLMRGQTLLGPHRDDFQFLLDEHEVKHFGSQGQQRTCALALKLMQLEIWKEELGYSPVLLLDDVAAELDLERQEALFKALPSESQIFITTTHLVNLPTLSKNDYQIIKLLRT